MSSELRWNPLLKTWTMVGLNRQNRPHMPKDFCPFCPGSGQVPDDYDVLSYDNDFPVLSLDPMAISSENQGLYQKQKAHGKCEVILYSPDHYSSLYALPEDHIEKLVKLWQTRTTKLYQNQKVQYVFPFENRGEEVGVTMPHPHGQIYAYPYVPLKLKLELDSAKDHFKAHGACLFCQMNQEEQDFKTRIIYENESFLAYLPFFTDYPFGLFITAKRHVSKIDGFSEKETKDLAETLKVVTGSFEKVFNRPFPYMMCLHQGPENCEQYAESDSYFHFHIEFYPPLRAENKIKWYASSEMGAWAAANVLAVEESALILRRAKFDFFAETKPLLVDQELRKEFTSFFGDNEEVRIFRAPGRVNLIGEHIDYNGGLVMPAAINQHLYLTIRPRQDKKIILHNLNFSESFEQDLDLDLNETTWAKYLCAILKLFKDKGFNFKNGFEGFFYSQIPAGAGLSSSAALELAFSFAMDKFNDFGLSRIDLARFCQEAENKYVGVACGIMDQFSVAMGEKDQVITLNCSDLSFRTSPLHLGDYELLIIYSGKSRTLDGSKYNERLAECQKALEIVKKLRPEIKNLCSIKPDELEGLQEYFEDELLFSRLRHVVCEAWRVQESEKALKAGNLSLFGEYLKESHLSLKNNYQVSGEELDLLFELSKSFSGCLGARMTGAGFGGSFIALVHKDSSQNFSDSLKDRYWKLTGLKAQVFSSKASAGVCEL